MPREKFRSQVRASTKEVSKLSREELLELLMANPFIVGQLREQDVNNAKARVLRRKADAAFKQYLAISEKISTSQPKGSKQTAAFYASIAESDSFFKKYQALWNKADRLEFGQRINKEVTHAAE